MLTVRRIQTNRDTTVELKKPKVNKIKPTPKALLTRLRVIVLATLVVACFGFALLAATHWASAAVGINHQINFQGKLVNLNGTNVTDGNYSVVFSLYTVAAAGTATWTETQSVTVTNGIFQVNLGSVTALPGSVDFNTDNLYLGIKVGSDAEMSPRIQFTSVPQAFNSEKLGGLDKTGFVQNQSGSPQTASFNINGTGVASTLQASTFDTSSAVTLSLGTSNASALTISKTGVATTVAGSLVVSQATTLTGGLINPGATLNTALALGNFTSGGALGTAAATVDTHSTFTVSQTTAGQSLTIPNPTVTTAGREIRISNISYTGTLANGKGDITYKLAGTDGIFGSSQPASALSGTCVAGGTTRYVRLGITLDDSGASPFTDSPIANVQDITINYSANGGGGGVLPDQRLHFGKTLQTATGSSALDTTKAYPGGGLTCN